MKTVHYFYDPMCGWCYGSTSLIAPLATRAEHGEWVLMLHPGGMIPRREIEPGFRQHIRQADQHIAQLTGAVFGDAYLNRLQGAQPLIFDSFITTQAIIAAAQLGIADFTMLKAIQAAHYAEGMDVAATATLAQLAASFGASADDWQSAMTAAHLQLDKQLQESHALMAQLGVNGYPTLLIEDDQGWQKLPHASFYGREDAWEQLLSDIS